MPILNLSQNLKGKSNFRVLVRNFQINVWYHVVDPISLRRPCLQLVAAGFSSNALAPVYTVSLDLPLKQRWATVMADYSAVVQELIKGVCEYLPITTANSNIKFL